MKIDDIDTDELLHAQAMYEYKAKKLAATASARGSEATKEAALQAEIDRLQAQLKYTEQIMLAASDALVEAAEERFALQDAEISALESQVRALSRMREIEKDSGTDSSGSVSS